MRYGNRSRGISVLGGCSQSHCFHVPAMMISRYPLLGTPYLWGIQHFRIDHADWLPADKGIDIFDDTVIESLVGFLGDITQMGGDYGVGQL